MQGTEPRKGALIDYGFRLPSAYDNRPLNFDEFYERVNQAVFVSATPGDMELQKIQGNCGAGYKDLLDFLTR